MKKLASAATALFCLVWLTGATWLPLFKSASGGAYTGPADAIVSPLGCWSLRACSAAVRGNAAAHVCNTVSGSDVGCGDLSTSATTGDLVAATIGGVTCPGAATCTVQYLYMQVGSITCAAGTYGFNCELDDSGNILARPALSTSCGSLSKGWCMVWSGSQVLLTSSGGPTSAINQPFTVSAVAKRTSGAQTGIFAGNGCCAMGFDTGANTGLIFANNSVNSTETDNAWHAFQGVFNGASSRLDVDATAGTPANAGANNIGTGKLIIGADAFGQKMNGPTTEYLLYGNALSGANSTALCHNQFSYWGTSTSC